MSIETFLLINLASDFPLLAVVSRVMGMFSWARVLAADLLCALLSAAAALRPDRALWVAVASPMLASLVITRRAAPRLWSLFTLTLVGQTLLCGGIARLAPKPWPITPLLCLAGGSALTALVGAGRPPGCRDWQVSLALVSGNRQVRFPALIDTGNRLREPLSGQPVLIVEKRLLKGLLPKGGYRTLAYGGLGGTGQMACFRPDGVWIGSGRCRRRGPDVWVAVSPDPLPGLCQALAPPEFALYRS